jgi:hypothetical protein
MQIPQSFAPIFWSYNIQALDTVTHQQLIISQILNHGTMESLLWLKKNYTPEEIKTVIAKSSRSAWSAKSLGFFASLYQTSPRKSERSALV